MELNHFIDGGGYKQLCMAMLKEAAQSLSSEKGGAARQANLDWLNGADAVVPFSLCMAAMGLDEHADRIRELIVNDPAAAMKHIVSAQMMDGYASRLNVLATLEDDAAVMNSYRRAARHAG